MARDRLKRIGFLTPLAALLLILVLVNILLSFANQSLNLDVAQRQQFVSQSMQLEALHREIVTTLATVAIKSNDPQLKTLLASQGLNLPDAPKKGEAK